MVIKFYEFLLALIYTIYVIPNRLRILDNRTANVIITSAFLLENTKQVDLYFHRFENYVFVVENNTTKTTTLLQRIFVSPVIYFWLLLIVLFVVIRCEIQWLTASETTNSATKRRRCVFMCQDTVQLSCGVVMHTKLFSSQRYRHVLFAHGATIVPCIAGMFISGLLYGEYLMRTEMPNIDTYAQLDESGVALCLPYGGVFSAFQGY